MCLCVCGCVCDWLLLTVIRVPLTAAHGRGSPSICPSLYVTLRTRRAKREKKHPHACMHQLYRTMLACLKKLSIWPNKGFASNKGLNLLFPNKNSRRKRMASTYLWPWVWPSVMVVTLKCATNVMLAKASPLNPRVLMFCRSSNCRSFDVVCLSQRIGKSSLWQQKVLEAIDQILIAAGRKKKSLAMRKTKNGQLH